MGLSPSVYIALVSWPFVMIGLATFLSPRRVVLISIIGGNILLPVASISFEGLPSYTRALASGIGALIPALMTSAPVLFSWRPKAMDLLFFGFLASTGISSLLNGLGPYDAFTSSANRVLEWGVAYWVGRSMFEGQTGLRELCIGIVVGGMVYAPLCIWEMVMSPQLNRQLYGFHASPFIMSKRMGGWRPTVFMPHGLAVGVWMASSAIVAWVLWRSRTVTRILFVPMSVIAIGLVLVTIGLRSTGAAILLVFLIGAVETVQLGRLRLALLGLVLSPVIYIGLRVVGWNGEQLVEWTGVFGPERAGSLNMRLENDALIVDRAMQRPIFGWGGWGRWRVRDEFGRDITVSDSWWAIVLGTTGIFGLVATYGTFIAPAFLLIRRKVRGMVFNPANGAAWALSMALLLFILDSLANAMPNATFMMAAGALVSFVLLPRRREEGRPGPAGFRDESAMEAEVGPTGPVSARHRPIDLR